VSGSAARKHHAHVSVFHGPDARYSPGLVLLPTGDAWEIRDETGELGAPDFTYGTWPSERDACREALRLLRSRFGEETLPVWGAGAPNDVLAELGYTRGRVRWRWWPAGLARVGELRVGLDGLPTGPTTPAA
jgi:hypothetical protein